MKLLLTDETRQSALQLF